MTDNQTVFIVDDDESVRDSLALLLRAAGLNVARFSSGNAFLEAVTSSQNGCLLLDVRMPGLNGLEVQKELTARHVVLPVIIMTGHGDLTMAVNAMKAGCIDFLQKPFDHDHILETVNAALEKSAKDWKATNQAETISRRLLNLTQRERDVLGELVAGNANKVIAYNLDISPRTVEIHRARVMEKMQARNIAHLLRQVIAADAMPEDNSST